MSMLRLPGGAHRASQAAVHHIERRLRADTEAPPLNWPLPPSWEDEDRRGQGHEARRRRALSLLEGLADSHAPLLEERDKVEAHVELAPDGSLRRLRAPGVDGAPHDASFLLRPRELAGHTVDVYYLNDDGEAR